MNSNSASPDTACDGITSTRVDSSDRNMTGSAITTRSQKRPVQPYVSIDSLSLRRCSASSSRSTAVCFAICAAAISFSASTSCSLHEPNWSSLSSLLLFDCSAGLFSSSRMAASRVLCSFSAFFKRSVATRTSPAALSRPRATAAPVIALSFFASAASSLSNADCKSAVTFLRSLVVSVRLLS